MREPSTRVKPGGGVRSSCPSTSSPSSCRDLREETDFRIPLSGRSTRLPMSDMRRTTAAGVPLGSMPQVGLLPPLLPLALPMELFASSSVSSCCKRLHARTGGRALVGKKLPRSMQHKCVLLRVHDGDERTKQNKSRQNTAGAGRCFKQLQAISPAVIFAVHCLLHGFFRDLWAAASAQPLAAAAGGPRERSALMMRRR